MKTLKLILLSIYVLVFASCGPKVRTTNPGDTPVQKYKTFAFLPNTNSKESESASYDKGDINTLVLNAISENLEQEGYKLDRSQPDLLVLISTETDTKLATNKNALYATYPYTNGITDIAPYYEPYYYYNYADYSNIIGYNYNTYTYEKGTLVIRLVERQTKESVWKGVASKPIYNETEKRAISKMVDDIFKKFPEDRLE